MGDAGALVVMTSKADHDLKMSGRRKLPPYLQTCRLLSLPAELRIHIYRLVLVQRPLGSPGRLSLEVICDHGGY